MQSEYLSRRDGSRRLLLADSIPCVFVNEVLVMSGTVYCTHESSGETEDGDKSVLYIIVLEFVLGKQKAEGCVAW